MMPFELLMLEGFSCYVMWGVVSVMLLYSIILCYVYGLLFCATLIKVLDCLQLSLQFFGLLYAYYNVMRCIMISGCFKNYDI